MIYDGTYDTYMGNQQLQNSLQSMVGKDWQDNGRAGYGYIFNGMPSNLTATQLKSFIENVYVGAQYLFMTDLVPSQNATFYGGYGNDWSAFTQAMSEI